MLVAENIVGKLVIFICQKAATHLAKLPFDKRKKASRSLTKLYYSVQALDDVTESIFRTADEFRTTTTGEAWVVMNALNNNMHEASLATNMFIDLGHELRAGLEIIDPALSQCCEALYISKFDFLTEMSEAITWNRSGETGRIIVKMPRQAIDIDALEHTYASVVEAYRIGNKTYWPDTWVPSDEPEEVVLTWEDNASAEAFLARLALHRKTLINAKEMLRNLLKENFSIEELLFQTDSHPYR